MNQFFLALYSLLLPRILALSWGGTGDTGGMAAISLQTLCRVSLAPYLDGDGSLLVLYGNLVRKDVDNILVCTGPLPGRWWLKPPLYGNLVGKIC